MKKSKKIFEIITFLAAVAVLSVFAGRDPVSAATKPAKPSIKIEAAKSGNGIKVTIDKTSNADGYRIYLKAEGETKFKNVKTLKKDGTKQRSYTIKNLNEATYTIKVKAYKKINGKTVWGKYSKSSGIVLKKPEPAPTVKPTPTPEMTLTPESTATFVFDPGVFGEYFKDGRLDVYQYGMSVGATDVYITDHQFDFVFGTYFIQVGYNSDNVNQADIAIGRWDTNDQRRWNITTYSYIFDRGDTVPELSGEPYTSKYALSLLPSVIEYMAQSKDPNTAPDIPGTDFKPCSEMESFDQY